MLHKDQISNIKIYSPEWFAFRGGKFTSSKISCLCAEEPLGKGAMTYIYHKVGETLTGRITAEDESFEDENTAWGHTHEPEAINKFGHEMKLQYLVTQKLIVSTDGRCSSTPDAIWVKSIAPSGVEYNVRSVEVKCPRKFARFIHLYECKTPADLKKCTSLYYWQKIDQMLVCDCAVGYFVIYHPQFPSHSNMRIIEFKKLDLWADFKLLMERKKMAFEKFDELKVMFEPQLHPID